MSAQNSIDECPSDKLSVALNAAQGDDNQGLIQVELLLKDYAFDPRLHFLRGSLLASLKRYSEAQEAMRRSIDIAPGYGVARFQLGLLQLTSGEAEAAEATWRPLHDLAMDEPLRIFATGLGHLIRDEFQRAVDLLEDGIARNTVLPQLNRDMQMLVTEARLKMSESGGDGSEPTSAVDQLLRQFDRGTKH